MKNGTKSTENGTKSTVEAGGMKKHEGKKNFKQKVKIGVLDMAGSVFLWFFKHSGISKRDLQGA